MRKRGLVVLAVLVAAVTPSYGSVIRDWFTGTVTSVAIYGTTPDLFHVGDPVWGLLTYGATPTSVSGTSTQANYEYNPEGVFGLSIMTGGFTFATQDGAGNFLLGIKNDDFELPSLLTDDVFAAGRRTAAVPGSPGLVYGSGIDESIHINQESNSSVPSLVTSPGVSLPFSINLSSAGSATGYIQSIEGVFENGYRVEFDITGYGQIPEPGSLPLILAGAAVLAAVRIFRR